MHRPETATQCRSGEFRDPAPGEVESGRPPRVRRQKAEVRGREDRGDMQLQVTGQVLVGSHQPPRVRGK